MYRGIFCGGVYTGKPDLFFGYSGRINGFDLIIQLATKMQMGLYNPLVS